MFKPGHTGMTGLVPQHVDREPGRDYVHAAQGLTLIVLVTPRMLSRVSVLNVYKPTITTYTVFLVL